MNKLDRLYNTRANSTGMINRFVPKVVAENANPEIYKTELHMIVNVVSGLLTYGKTREQIIEDYFAHQHMRGEHRIEKMVDLFKFVSVRFSGRIFMDELFDCILLETVRHQAGGLDKRGTLFTRVVEAIEKEDKEITSLWDLSLEDYRAVTDRWWQRAA